MVQVGLRRHMIRTWHMTMSMSVSVRQGKVGVPNSKRRRSARALLRVVDLTELVWG